MAGLGWINPCEALPNPTAALAIGDREHPDVAMTVIYHNTVCA